MRIYRRIFALALVTAGVWLVGPSAARAAHINAFTSTGGTYRKSVVDHDPLAIRKSGAEQPATAGRDQQVISIEDSPVIVTVKIHHPMNDTETHYIHMEARALGRLDDQGTPSFVAIEGVHITPHVVPVGIHDGYLAPFSITISTDIFKGQAAPGKKRKLYLIAYKVGSASPSDVKPIDQENVIATFTVITPEADDSAGSRRFTGPRSPRHARHSRHRHTRNMK